jgi:type IV pilus assembly protein PilA
VEIGYLISFSKIQTQRRNIMLNKMVKKDEKGFTLIELMIVIAIIGILAAIAIPQFNAYRTRAYDASANTDAKNFYTAAVSYASGDQDRTFDADNLPAGFQGDPPISGSFTYTAATGVIACTAAFKHPQGVVTYTLDDDGNITNDQ